MDNKTEKKDKVKFLHSDFLELFKSYKAEMGDFENEYDKLEYGDGKEVIICPEPITFLSELDDCADDTVKCQKKFREMSRGFQRVSVEKAPNSSIFWFNRTRHGINLRPGISELQKASSIRMGDAGVHALMAGQTGSGKSVMLNNLIFNLLMEYPPWELDLYLADFKRVEFSRYMNEHRTPHLCACAATGEIKYVLSMIKYLVDCMTARETFFARMGIQKIGDFLSDESPYKNMVLPRILLIVDEFQQLFLEANAKESEAIHSYMTAIVKKGRATGLHILFASQEMSGTLSRSDLANFSIRFGLHCSAAVSMDVLGNRAASRIRVGNVLVNTGDGTESSNMKFQVPDIEVDTSDDSESYFQGYLRIMEEMAEEYGFSKSQKFYQEDKQDDISVLENILDYIKPKRAEFYPERNRKFFEVFTLGQYVTFSNKRFDIQTLFIEYGRNKNILAISPKADDLAYLQKLFAVNIAFSPICEKIKHELYVFDNNISSLYSIDTDLFVEKLHTNSEDILQLENKFMRMRMLKQIFKVSHTPLDLALANYRANLSMNRRGSEDPEIISCLTEIFGDSSMSDAPELYKKIMEGNYADQIKIIANNLMSFYKYRQSPDEVFPQTIYWITGVDSIERFPDWLLWMMKNGMDYNIMFIFTAAAEFDNIQYVAKHCDYLFAGGTNPRIYERMGMNYSQRQADSIALDMRIKSVAEDRSFKKYKCSFAKRESPSIPFDEWLKDME